MKIHENPMFAFQKDPSTGWSFHRLRIELHRASGLQTVWRPRSFEIRKHERKALWNVEEVNKEIRNESKQEFTKKSTEKAALWIETLEINYSRWLDLLELSLAVVLEGTIRFINIRRIWKVFDCWQCAEDMPVPRERCFFLLQPYLTYILQPYT